jgi:chloramphenicol 3-O-phosphotransferase
MIAFVVVRGPALAGKTSVAQSLVALIPGKVASISQDDLWERWITRHDADLAAETELVYRQMKLLAASYIRARYHVVVDAAFAVWHDGVAATHESDLRDLFGLVSTIHDVRPLLVGVTAPLETLLDRAQASARWDARAVEALYRAFERAALPSAVVLDSSVLAADQAAQRIRAHFGRLS